MTGILVVGIVFRSGYRVSMVGMETCVSSPGVARPAAHLQITLSFPGGLAAPSGPRLA